MEATYVSPVRGFNFVRAFGMAVGGSFTHGDKRLFALTCTAGLQELGPKREYSAPALRAADFPRHFLYLVITKGRESESLRKKFIFKAPLAHPELLRPPGFIQFLTDSTHP